MRAVSCLARRWLLASVWPLSRIWVKKLSWAFGTGVFHSRRTHHMSSTSVAYLAMSTLQRSKSGAMDAVSLPPSVDTLLPSVLGSEDGSPAGTMSEFMNEVSWTDDMVIDLPPDMGSESDADAPRNLMDEDPASDGSGRARHAT